MRDPFSSSNNKPTSWLTSILLNSTWMNFNVTPSMISTCLQTSSLWSHIRDKDRQSEMVRGFFAYQLHNQTGINLCFTAGGGPPCHVEHRGNYAFNFPHGGGRGTEWLSVALGGSSDFAPVRVGRVGKVLTEISDMKLIVEVTLKGGSKVSCCRHGLSLSVPPTKGSVG